MNKSELETKLGVVVLDTPVVYHADDETKVNIQLPCTHCKLVTIKSLMKKTPKCSICKPPKPRQPKQQIDREVALDVMFADVAQADADFREMLLQAFIEDDVVKAVKIFTRVKGVCKW